MKSLFVPKESERRSNQYPPIAHRRYDWQLIGMIGCGLVFLLVNLNLKTTLILLLVISVVSICVAIELWLIFKIFELMTWVLVESMRWTRLWVRANFDHRLDWLFSGLIGVSLFLFWTPLIPLSCLLAIAALPKFRASRQLSSDVNLPVDRLETFAHHWDRQTRRNVASNPNTPPNILMHLLLEFPRSVAENPAFDLWRFADLGLMASILEKDLIKVLADRRVPELFIEAAIHRRTPKLTTALLKQTQLNAETI